LNPKTILGHSGVKLIQEKTALQNAVTASRKKMLKNVSDPPHHLQLGSGLCRGGRRCVNLHGHWRGCHHGAVIITFVHVSYSQLNSIAVVFQKFFFDGADPFNVKFFCLLYTSPVNNAM